MDLDERNEQIGCHACHVMTNKIMLRSYWHVLLPIARIIFCGAPLSHEEYYLPSSKIWYD